MINFLVIQNTQKAYLFRHEMRPPTYNLMKIIFIPNNSINIGL